MTTATRQRIARLVCILGVAVPLGAIGLVGYWCAQECDSLARQIALGLTAFSLGSCVWFCAAVWHVFKRAARLQAELEG